MTSAAAGLTKTRPAPVALLFPYTHWQLSGKPWAPHYAHQLLLRSGGQSDILHEEVARREGRFSCQALALLQTDYLSDDIAARLTRFVDSSGVKNSLVVRVLVPGEPGPCS